MDPAKIRSLLERVKSGESDVDDALDALKALPFADLGYAVVDHHRALRQGVPEVILGEGKTAPQIVGIAQELVRTGQNVLVTRLDAAKAREVTSALPSLRYHEMARVATYEHGPIARLGARPVALVSAGTSDLPVAEEAAETLRMLGGAVERHYDVGVAGIHRLLHRREALSGAAVIVVGAGCRALASVAGARGGAGHRADVGGVWRSSGAHGALGMLTSCASR